MSWPISQTYDRQVYTVASPIVSEEGMIDDWKLIPIKAARAGVSVSEVFKNELLTGFGAKVSSAVRYAQNPEKYPLGLPNVTGLHNAVGVAAILALLEESYDNPVIDYHQFGGINPLHAAYEKLINTYGYVESKNQIGVLSHHRNAPVYLEHISIDTTLATVKNNVALESLPTQRAMPFDNAFADAKTYFLDETLDEGDLGITYYYAYLGVEPLAGTASRAIWDSEGVPEAYQRLKTSQETVVLNQGELTFGELYGYNFQLTFDDDRLDPADFIVRGTLHFLLSFLGYNTDSSYFQTKFTYFAGSRQRSGYFTYEQGLNTNAELEAAVALNTGQTEYMPWLFFRSDYQNLADESLWETEEYKQRSNLASRMGLDYQEYADIIHEAPEIDTIVQAFFCFGVPLNTQHQHQIRYLHEFFYRRGIDEQYVYQIESANVSSRASMWYWQSEGIWNASTTGVYSLIAFSNLDVRMSLRYGGIDVEHESGRIGSIGHCTLQQTEYPFWYRERDVVPVGDGVDQLQWVRRTSTIDVLVLRRQINENTYITIRVADPKMSYLLADDEGLKKREAEVALGDNSADFIIPVSYAIANELFSGLKKQLFFKQSATVIKNAYVKTELDWYQSPAFITSFTIISLFISIASLGTTTAGIKLLYAQLLVKHGAIAAAILTVTITIGAKVGLDAIFEFAVKKLGADSALIATTLALVAASVAAYKGSPNVGYYMQAATGLQAATDEQIAREIEGLQEEWEEFKNSDLDFLEGLQEEIDAVADSKYLFAQIGLIQKQPVDLTPTEYYDLRIHTHNIGALAVHSTDAMIQQLLALPTKTR